ncbi:MAG: Hsp70 family protein [Armatimonadota bacterium]
MHETTCGIDFGTSNTLAAIAAPEGTRICEIDPANADPRLLPTLLYFSRHDFRRIGRSAVTAYQADPFGRFVRALKSALPEVTPDEQFRMFRRAYTLVDLLTLVLRRVKEQVDACAGAPVTQVTLGRPVRFSPDPGIDARAEGMLREAAELAGFTGVRFLSEPEAVTRYFYAATGERSEGTVLIFDFGGGTLDLCVARTGGSGYSVLATGGRHIGGTLLDRILFENKLLHHLGKGETWSGGLELPRSLFNRLVNPDANWRITEQEYTSEVRRIFNASAATGGAARLATLHTVVSRRLGPDLFAAIEAAKVRLSEEERTTISYQADGVSIEEPLSRADLRTLFREQLQEIRRLIDETLAKAGLAPREIDRVLLAGGSSALICTQELLREIFGEERVPLRQDLYTSIVSGLALDAAAG